ncbi:MAG: hypothetical protein RLZZ135_2453 [Cyanobacteriota bacterium]|jgi:hypothetical protein
MKRLALRPSPTRLASEGRLARQDIAFTQGFIPQSSNAQETKDDETIDLADAKLHLNRS